MRGNRHRLPRVRGLKQTWLGLLQFSTRRQDTQQAPDMKLSLTGILYNNLHAHQPPEARCACPCLVPPICHHQ